MSDRLRSGQYLTCVSQLVSLTDSNLDACVGEDLDCGFRNKASAEQQGLLGGVAQLGLDSGNERCHTALRHNFLPCYVYSQGRSESNDLCNISFNACRKIASNTPITDMGVPHVNKWWARARYGLLDWQLTSKFYLALHPSCTLGIDFPRIRTTDTHMTSN